MFPPLTARIMKRMEEELPPTTCRQILTWNYHKIPAEAFKEAKERLEKAVSIDEYLKGEHKRLVDIMERCIKQGGLWYEQQITPEVLDFVKANQEITTGIRNGESIYVTKIPYAPEQYLAEKDPMMKRYYACHCQLARTAIRDGKPKIPPTFCYCSAGFTKTKFDTVFGEPVEIELLESALKGDMHCRFVVRIPKGKMK
jgi:predicted hydrocarbon binding protein